MSVDAQTLIERAAWVAARSIVIHQGTEAVGCALTGESGDLYEGVYVAGAYGYLSRHAEDTAITHAAIHGEQRITRVAIVAGHEEPMFPCGTCRELLVGAARRSGRDIEILCGNLSGKYVTILASELLPKGGRIV